MLAAHPAYPKTCTLLTTLMFASFVAVAIPFSKTDSLLLFVASIAATAILIPASRFAARAIGSRIMVKKNLDKPENLRKFSDQAWQFVTHVAMTAFEVYLLARPEVNWTWWTDPGAPGSTWAPVDQSKDYALNLFYIVQLAIWFYTAFAHRFMDARHKDYLAMFSHHIATIILVAGSWFMGCLRIGLLVLLIHDASDIIVDTLKLCNYLGWDADSGMPVTEVMFVANLVSWAYWRLYLFPTHVNWSVATHRLLFCATPGGGVDPTNARGTYTLLWFLYFLQALHVWWFFLFLRMAYRLIVGHSAHSAAREEYEGDSDKED